MKNLSICWISVGILLAMMAVTGTYGAAVMSIDLGSEWIKIGVVSPGVPLEIALNKESKRKTPAVIAFREGNRIFGEDAQTIGLRFPDKSYKYLMDLLGKQIDNPLVKLYQKRFPYYNIEGDSERNTIVFKAGDDTSFTVEELVAQFIQKARDFAEESTGQIVTECVIIVPGYFGQAERRALLTSANLANIKVLQLINDYTAVALNYGIFQRKEINETAQYYLFYDMGAYKTSAAVVSYQLVKDKATRETNPVIQVLGVGYDRTLGGLEMQLRLRDYLAREFNAMKKTKTDVFTNARAMEKLFKESGRVKNVLSANANHFAQIEGLIEEIDFKFQVTREVFEDLCTDLFERVPAPLNRALTTSGLTLSEITQVILFGGGTRVPKIQEVLRNAIDQDLGKNINMDEAAALGGAYRAADLATGFKVKKFVTKDATVFPIQVTFEREGESGAVKLVKRSLFGPMNSYPQKKVITFNKHTDNFEFNVNYAELEYLDADEVAAIGSLNLTKIKLTDVAKILSENLNNENIESKGIKAHFVIDDSGIFDVTSVELVLEKTVIESADDTESPLSKLGSTISKLFSSDKNEDGGDGGDGGNDTATEEPSSTDAPPTTESGEANADSGDSGEENKPKTDDNTNNNNNNENSTTSSTTDEVKKTEPKPKILTIKQSIPNSVDTLYSRPLDGNRLNEARKKIDELNEQERAITRRETALNALESYVIEANQRLDETEYSSCGTETEIEAVRKACAEVSDWLYEDGENADAETYEKRLNELKSLTDIIYARHWEHNERPEALKTLRSLIKSAKEFFNSAKNFTKEINPEKDVYTPVEIETLDKTITETDKWLVEEIKAQNLLANSEPVRLTVKALTDKMALIDREVKYLVNKLKIWKPKVKKEKKEKKEEKVISSGEDEQQENQEQLPPLENDEANDDNTKPIVENEENEENFVVEEQTTGGDEIKPVTPIEEATEVDADNDDSIKPLTTKQPAKDTKDHSEL